MHVSEPEKAIHEIYRLLKPGGYSIICEAEDSFMLLKPDIQPEYLFNKLEKVVLEL